MFMFVPVVLLVMCFMFLCTFLLLVVVLFILMFVYVCTWGGVKTAFLDVFLLFWMGGEGYSGC